MTFMCNVDDNNFVLNSDGQRFLPCAKLRESCNFYNSQHANNTVFKTLSTSYVSHAHTHSFKLTFLKLVE